MKKSSRSFDAVRYMVYEIHEVEFDDSAYIAKYGLGLGEGAG